MTKETSWYSTTPKFILPGYLEGKKNRGPDRSFPASRTQQGSPSVGCAGRSGQKIRVGNKLYFTDKDDNDILVAEVVDNTTSRGRTIRFLYDNSEEEFRNDLDLLGNTPLPKYITRPVEAIDKERYQTVYAKETGAVAAPTAGLHFSRN